MSEQERRVAADEWLAALTGWMRASQISLRDRGHLSQSAAKIAAELPEDREAALFLLARAADIHAAIFKDSPQ